MRRYRPHAVAVVGIGAYRIAFDRPRAGFGRQPEDLAGALLWVLPNTSGLNAHYQAADSLAPSLSCVPLSTSGHALAHRTVSSAGRGGGLTASTLPESTSSPVRDSAWKCIVLSAISTSM